MKKESIIIITGISLLLLSSFAITSTAGYYPMDKDPYCGKKESIYPGMIMGMQSHCKEQYIWDKKVCLEEMRR